MRATAIEVSDTRAAVVLSPCWRARLFGARPRVVEMEREPKGEWYTVATRRQLGWFEYSCEIRNALDFRVVSDLPRARSVPR